MSVKMSSHAAQNEVHVCLYGTKAMLVRLLGNGVHLYAYAPFCGQNNILSKQRRSQNTMGWNWQGCTGDTVGGAENAGPENAELKNDGPYSRGRKCWTWKVTEK